MRILTDILPRTVSKLSQIIVKILDENGHCVFEPPFRGLRATFTVHLRLIGKLAVNFLFMLLGRPMLVGKALSFTHELSFFLFLSIHRAQQPRSRWPSNVFRMFDRR